jgi:signal transduction histidine kinase
MTEEQRARALEAIGQEGKRLDALSQKLMELFRLRGAGALAVREESIPLLFERVSESLEFRLRRDALTLSVCCDVEKFNLDAELFQVLLINLVDNAAKASQPGGEIELSARREPRGVVFEVSDHGCGIAEADLQRVLQPFYMADKARSRAQNGAGLGLTLAEAIARAHGARLAIESRLGEGTRIRIVFAGDQA